MNLNNIFFDNPLYLKKNKKSELILNQSLSLTKFHFKKCKEYKKIINYKNINFKKIKSLNDIPYLPANLFKKYLLKSVSNTQVFKTLKSSGTSSQKPSTIVLDKFTSTLQSKVLIKTLSSFVDLNRSPMIIIDSKNIIEDRINFSARAAGILGFSLFSTERLFLLNDKMDLKLSSLKNFLKKHKNRKILIFGFTHIIWKYFIKKIKDRRLNINLSNAVLIHGGGWKKMTEDQIDNTKFKKILKTKFKLKKVHNYYGMVEQTGSIYIECEKGYLHSSSFNDIIIRDQNTLEPKKNNSKGVIQVFSVLPHSYPGHSILTEDLGQIFGDSDCKCGRTGKYFKVFGRLQNSEIRGCSDTYE